MTPLTSVLIVDDEPAVRDLVSRWAISLGLNPKTAGDAEEALTIQKTEHCDLAVIDIMMPGHDGLWLAAELQRQHPHTAVIIATAYTALFNEGRTPVADLLVKPFARGRFELAVDRGRQWRKDALDDGAWHARLVQELRDRVEQICADIPRHAVGGATEDDILTAMALTRIPGAMAHGERVRRYAVSVARELGLGADEISTLASAARLHDIGTLAIPESLLNKPSALSSNEQAIVRRHVDTGAEILAATDTLHHLTAIVAASHECFGGGGYPHHLAGNAIPIAARIIAVADAYDAMTHALEYRGGIGVADAVSELLRCSGTQFDPAVVDAFLAVLGRH